MAAPSGGWVAEMFRRALVVAELDIGLAAAHEVFDCQPFAEGDRDVNCLHAITNRKCRYASR